MKPGAIVSTILFVLGAFIVLIQLWFAPWAGDVFFKIIITLSVLLAVSLVLSFVLKEAADTRKLKEENDLNNL